VRQYVNYETGERMPGNETVSLERASDDLSRQRASEKQEAQKVDEALLQFQVDASRQGLDPVALAQQLQQQQQEQQQQQQQPEAQAAEIQPQPQTDVPPEIAELQQELERSPRLKQMLLAEAQNIQQAQAQAAQTQQAFTQAADQAKNLAVVSMMAAFPELTGISVDALPAALNVMRAHNPQRFTEAVSHLARIDQFGKAAVAAQEQQRAVAQQQNAAWTKAQDDAFDAATANDTPETRSKIAAEAVAMLKEYGASDDDIRQAWHSPGPFRSAVGQRVLRDAAAYRLAQKEVGQKLDRSAPAPVQRPGSPQRNS
jgi:hypothetical protein